MIENVICSYYNRIIIVFGPEKVTLELKVSFFLEILLKRQEQALTRSSALRLLEDLPSVIYSHDDNKFTTSR